MASLDELLVRSGRFEDVRVQERVAASHWDALKANPRVEYCSSVWERLRADVDYGEWLMSGVGREGLTADQIGDVIQDLTDGSLQLGVVLLDGVMVSVVRHRNFTVEHRDTLLENFASARQWESMQRTAEELLDRYRTPELVEHADMMRAATAHSVMMWTAHLIEDGWQPTSTEMDGLLQAVEESRTTDTGDTIRNAIEVVVPVLEMSGVAEELLAGSERVRPYAPYLLELSAHPHIAAEMLQEQEARGGRGLSMGRYWWMWLKSLASHPGLDGELRWRASVLRDSNDLPDRGGPAAFGPGDDLRTCDSAAVGEVISWCEAVGAPAVYVAAQLAHNENMTDVHWTSVFRFLDRHRPRGAGPKGAMWWSDAMSALKGSPVEVGPSGDDVGTEVRHRAWSAVPSTWVVENTLVSALTMSMRVGGSRVAGFCDYVDGYIAEKGLDPHDMWSVTLELAAGAGLSTSCGDLLRCAEALVAS